MVGIWLQSELVKRQSAAFPLPLVPPFLPRQSIVIDSEMEFPLIVSDHEVIISVPEIIIFMSEIIIFGGGKMTTIAPENNHCRIATSFPAFRTHNQPPISA